MVTAAAPAAAHAVRAVAAATPHVVAAIIVLLGAVTAMAGNPEGLPEEMLDAIRSDAADRIIYEDDQGLILLDTNFNPKRIYDPSDSPIRNVLRDNVYGDLIRFSSNGEREMVGLLLLIKHGAFVWPADLRFQAVVVKKDRVAATVPMDLAIFALVERDETLTWFELGEGAQRTLLPRMDRLVPTQLSDIPGIYRIYMFFPGRIEIEGQWRTWSPFKLREVSIEPVRGRLPEQERSGSIEPVRAALPEPVLGAGQGAGGSR